MYVVRPKGIRGTPSDIAQALHTQTRRYPNRQPVRFDYRRDFFMTPVAPQDVSNAPDTYSALYNFLTRNKYGQRKILGQYVNVPACAASQSEAAALSGDKFVVRPLRHFGGMGYRVTENKLDFAAGSEYISELYPKKREYRVIFVFGKPLIWLRKKPNGGCTSEDPWGHENSFFQTINDVPNSRLCGTDCVARLTSSRLISTAHIVAADILYNGRLDQKYAVLELNVCPSLQIDNNREKVVDAIRQRV